MKQIMASLTFCYVVFCLSGTTHAQTSLATDPALERDIIATGLVHSPLPLDASRSFEATGRTKKVVNSEAVASAADFANWSHSGLGVVERSFDKTPGWNLLLTLPASTGQRAQGPPDDPDYATYGNGGAMLRLAPDEADWSGFNRVAFRVLPECEVTGAVNLNLTIGGVSHLVNLTNRKWNDCFFDIEGLDRNHIEIIGFSCTIRGGDSPGGELRFHIDGLERQLVEDLDPESGWAPASGKIIHSTSGYRIGGPKTAIITAANHGGRFSLVDDATGRTIIEGAVEKVATTIGEFVTADFTSLNVPGRYRLHVGGVETPPFEIGPDVWTNSLWRVLSFIFSQRCGHPVPGIHGVCHTDLFSMHNGQRISYAGGWHDAGDLSQQTLQTGDVYFSLLEASAKLKESNPMLAARLLEEAEWGLEFTLRQRYGDGYRASSVGLLIWLDGVIDSFDDINSVRVQNLAFDNFLHSAYEAYAAMTIDRDPRLQERLTHVAKADFDFAMERHREVGYGEFIHFYEHSYNTSESQYMATISWAASMLYKLTGEQRYADIAAEYIRYTLDCQRTEPLGDKAGTRGFFYRDTTRRSIVHYIHQSREQVYMQALTLLCETQPNHVDHARWEGAIRLYGDYLKGLMRYTAPYGMLPSGVYHVNEPADEQGFSRLHLWPPANAVELYGEQVRSGIRLDDEHYVRRFPVWFSIFNGNTAVHLSMGKAAAICGNFLGDKELLDIGLEQMYWTVGKNPFGQSLIYGEGYNYPSMDSFSSGEMTGEMPVGIRSLGNDDVPYWPRAVNACYKEVWVTSAGKWLSLAAEYE